MKKKRMVIYDHDKVYAANLMEYLEGMEDFPYAISAFSQREILLEFAKTTTVSLLLASETSYQEIRNEIETEQVMILNESGELTWKDLQNIRKFQSADRIVQEIMHYYVEETAVLPDKLTLRGTAKLIGLYSPVRRCSQTTLGLTLGQILAEDNKTLYLNFESLSGFPYLMGYDGGRDLTDLLYLLEKAPKRFPLQLRASIRKLENLDYVPPMNAMHQLLLVRPEQWVRLVSAVIKEGDYDVVILDLSEGMQGLFEILRMCSHIYTVVKEDRYAKAKIAQYEQLLALCEYEDILKKTVKRRVPFIKELTEDFLFHPGGELACYVKKMLKEDGI